MAKKKLKYKINHYLSTQSKYTSVEHFVKKINNDFGVSKDIFNRDRNMAADDANEIPIQRLCIYAAMFDTKVELLKE